MQAFQPNWVAMKVLSPFPAAATLITGGAAQLASVMAAGSVTRGPTMATKARHNQVCATAVGHRHVPGDHRQHRVDELQHRP